MISRLLKIIGLFCKRALLKNDISLDLSLPLWGGYDE